MSATASSNRRLIALVLTALGIWFFRDSFNTDTPVPRKPVRVAGGTGSNTVRGLRGNPPEDVCAVPTSMPQRVALLAKARANPFVAPPPPPLRLPKPAKVLTVSAVAPVAIEPASAPMPPPNLPYIYIGQFVDPGHPTTVFLSLGNALLNVNPGDTLDGGFRLESIGPKELVFVHVQRNVTLRMPIEGERL